MPITAPIPFWRALLLSFLCTGLAACRDRPGENIESSPTSGGTPIQIPPSDSTKPHLQRVMIIRMEGDIWAQYLALLQEGPESLRASSASFFEYDTLGRLMTQQKRFYAGGSRLDDVLNTGMLVEQDTLDYHITEPDTRTQIDKRRFANNLPSRRTLIEEDWDGGQLSRYVESIYAGNEVLIDIQDASWTHDAEGKPLRWASQSRLNPLLTRTRLHHYTPAGDLARITTDQGHRLAEFRYNARGDWTEASLYDETGRLVRCLDSETGWINNGLGIRVVIEWDASGVTACEQLGDDERALRAVEAHYYGLTSCHPANLAAQAYLTPDNRPCTPRSRWSDTVFQ